MTMSERIMECVEVATYTDPSRFNGRAWKQAARPACDDEPLDASIQRSVERAGATFNPAFLRTRTFAEPVTIRYRDSFDFGDHVDRLVQHGAPAKAAAAFKFISAADQGSPPAWWLGTGEDCSLCFNRVRHRRCLPLQDGPRDGERPYPTAESILQFILQSGLTHDRATAAKIASDMVARHRQSIDGEDGDPVTQANDACTQATHDLTARIFAMQTRPRPRPIEDGMLAVWQAWKVIH